MTEVQTGRPWKLVQFLTCTAICLYITAYHTTCTVGMEGMSLGENSRRVKVTADIRPV